MFHLPDAPSLKYSVGMAVHLNGSDSNIVLAQTCKVPMPWDSGNGTTCGDEDVPQADKYYFFSNLSVKEGEHTLRLTALDSTREVLSREYKLNVGIVS